MIQYCTTHNTIIIHALPCLTVIRTLDRIRVRHIQHTARPFKEDYVGTICVYILCVHLSGDKYGYDLYGYQWSVITVSLDTVDRHDDVHAFRHFAEHGMLRVT